MPARRRPARRRPSFIYQLYFDRRVLHGDAVRDFDGVEVIVDKMSAPYLDGSTIDFEDTIEKQGSPSITPTQ